MSTPMPPRRSRRELREQAEQAEQTAAAAPAPESLPEPVAESQPILVRSRRRRRTEEQDELGAAPSVDPQTQAPDLEVAPAAPIRVSRRAHRIAEAPDFDTPAVELPQVFAPVVEPPAVEDAEPAGFAEPADSAAPVSFDVPSVLETPSVVSAQSAATPEVSSPPQAAPLRADNSLPVTSFADFQQGANSSEPAVSPQALPGSVSGWSTFASGEPASFDSEEFGQPSWAAVSPTQVPGMVEVQSSPSAEPAPVAADTAPAPADSAASAAELESSPQVDTPKIGFGVLPDIPANPEVVNWGSMAAGITRDTPGEFHAAEVALAAQERDTSDDTTDGDRSDLPTYSWLQLAILAGAAVILALIVWLVLESRNTEETSESMPQDGISQTIDLENTSVIN